ncbi:MAG: hypothetical protein RIF41_13320 [Polyangiaceae bacterium]
MMRLFGRVGVFAGVVVVASAAMGCDRFDPPPPPPQTVVIRVNSDPGKPLKGADVLFGGSKVGVTGADGAAEIKLAGRDGEVFDVSVACPKGFESPKTPVRVTLHRLAEEGKRPEYTVQCPPKTRTIVIAVRADGVEDLPVTLLDREIARTDSSGAAHVVLTLEPGEQFELVLDTSDEKFENLKPQNPFMSFSVSQSDDIFAFDPKFEREKPKKVYYHRPTAVGPKRIGN